MVPPESFSTAARPVLQRLLQRMRGRHPVRDLQVEGFFLRQRRRHAGGKQQRQQRFPHGHSLPSHDRPLCAAPLFNMLSSSPAFSRRTSRPHRFCSAANGASRFLRRRALPRLLYDIIISASAQASRRCRLQQSGEPGIEDKSSNHRRRSGRIVAWATTAPLRHRQRHSRAPDAANMCSAASAPACSRKARWRCSTRSAPARAPIARGWSITASNSPSAARRHRIDMHGRHRQDRHDLRPDRGDARPDERPQGGRPHHGLSGRRRQAARFRYRPPARHLRQGRRQPRDRMRLHRRLRRLSRRQPRQRQAVGDPDL